MSSHAEVVTQMVLRDMGMQAGLQQHRQALNDFAESGSRNFSAMQSGLSGLSAKVTAFATAATAAMKAVEMATNTTVSIFKTTFNVMSDLVGLASTQEKAEAKLAAAIRATGGAAGWTKDQMMAMAGDMSKVSTVGDEVIASSMAIMTGFGNVRGDVFRDAMQGALDMSAAFGTDLTAATTQVGKALNDPIKGISSLNSIGVTFSETQKETIKNFVEQGNVAAAQGVILDELRGKVGGMAEAEAKTFSGRLQQMWSRLGDIGEKIGAAIIPALDEMSEWLEVGMSHIERFTPLIAEWVSWGMQLAKTAGGWIVDGFKALAKGAIIAWTAGETAVNNLRTVWELYITQAIYWYVLLGNNVKHWFVEVIPAYLKWFADNWVKIFRDLSVATGTILLNIGKNIYSFVASVVNVIKGGEWDWKWTGLLDGFRATVGELPRIAERVPGELEQRLRAQMREKAGILGDDFSRRLADRMGWLDSYGRGDGETTDMTHSASPFEMAGTDDDDEEEAEGSAGGKRSPFEGLEALYSRIAGAAASDPSERAAREAERRQIDLQEKSLATQERQAETLERLERDSAAAREMQQRTANDEERRVEIQRKQLIVEERQAETLERLERRGIPARAS